MREMSRGVDLDLADLSARVEEVREDVVEARKAVTDAAALEKLARAAAILYSLAVGAEDAARRTRRILAIAVEVVEGRLPAAEALREDDDPVVVDVPAPEAIPPQRPARERREVVCRCGCGAVFTPPRGNIRFATGECRTRYRKAYKVEYMQGWWAERGNHYNQTRREGRTKE